MKAINTLCVFFIGAFCVSVLAAQPDKDWASFKSVYRKQYRSAKDDTDRQAIWKKNLAIIEKHNREASLGRSTFTLGMNEYGDLTGEEFAQRMYGFKMPPKTNTSQVVQQTFSAAASLALPTSVDWRSLGYVTPVKDQGQCGSCWAFSATGSLEGQNFKKTGKLVSLSEQNLVDCSSAYGNQGCNGGWMVSSFQYIRDNKGINTGASYPYTASQGTCKFQTTNIGANVSSYTEIPSGSESTLQQAIATVGPVSVAICVVNSFQLYRSGVYKGPTCSPSQLNHAVLAVGYKKASGSSYYIVKNSWGTSWGESGYIRMSLGTKNLCGIATAASYPRV